MHFPPLDRIIQELKKLKRQIDQNTQPGKIIDRAIKEIEFYKDNPREEYFDPDDYDKP